MTLLAELQSLDISNILNARASITTAMGKPELEVVLDGGAAQTTLAGLGSSLQTIQDSIGEPSAILVPLVDAVGELAGPLNTDALPLAEYLEAVTEGATIIAGLFEGIDDPLTFGSAIGFSLGGALESAVETIDNYTQIGLDNLVQYRHLIETVESGVPTDPQTFAEMAIDVLLPFPRTHLIEIRDGLRGIIDGARAITFPTGRTAGLVNALEAVTAAATTGDIAALELALQNLELVRTNTISVIQGELLSLSTQIQSLHIDQALEPVIAASGALNISGEGTLEFLETWRRYMVAARQQLENLDPTQAAAFITPALQILEETLRARFVQAIDESVREVEAWVRNLLSHLPLHDLRFEISKFIQDIVQAIQDADLDQYAQAVREMLDDIQTLTESANLGDEIQAALGDAQQAITGALSDLVSALSTIGTEIDALAGQAEDILQRVAGALADFQAVVSQVTIAVENLGIEQAQQQVVDTLRELREAAEALLSLAPLPDSMRPMIEQLINTLEGVDFDVVFEPVRAAVAELEIPDDVSAGITGALEATKDALENLIPTEVIEGIEAEVNEALDVIRGFDPSTLLSGVTDTINEAADFIEGLDPRPAVADIRGPYQAVLDAIDAAHPQVLLGPVIEAYDSLMGSIPTPSSPDTFTQQAAEAIKETGENIGRAALQPITQMMPADSTEVTEPGPTTETPTLPQPDDVRLGNVVRMFGFLPNKLRETLAGLDEEAAGEALQAVDAFCGGLARDLRGLQDELWAIEARINDGVDALLGPLGGPQLQAQLAIEANFSADAFDTTVAVSAVAQAGPGAMRAALLQDIRATCEQAQATAAGAVRQSSTTLGRAATALERCHLSGLGGDLDAFLAALDPEPIAAEFDAFAAAALAQAALLIPQMADELRAAVQKFQAIAQELNPAAQAHKFLVVFEAIYEELQVLNPRWLAAELGEVHTAIRKTVEAYDPTIFAEEVYEIITTVAASLRALDPATLLGDLSFLDDTLNQVTDAMPSNALAGVGDSLATVGAQLAELDPVGLLVTLESLGPEVIDAFEAAVEAIRREIVALLEAIRYASGSVSVSVSVTAEAGAG